MTEHKPIFQIPDEEQDDYDEPATFSFPHKGPLAKEVKAWCRKNKVDVWEQSDSLDGETFSDWNNTGEMTTEQKTAFKLAFSEHIETVDDSTDE